VVAAAAAAAAAPEAATQTATAATPGTSSNMGSDNVNAGDSFLPPSYADNFGSTPQCLCKQHSHASQQSLH